MPRRFNYTGRKKIELQDVSIRLVQNGDSLSFDADFRLGDYGLEILDPPPRVLVEAYRGASTLWKRFDFGRFSTLHVPDDRSLDEFGVPEGILFRVKVTAVDDDALGRLVAEADQIRPRLPDAQDGHAEPLIQHVPANDIGDELWRVDFSGPMPLIKINNRVPMGVEQFLRDPQHRAAYTPAVMRQVLSRILIVDRGEFDEEDPTCWQARWLRFAHSLPGGTEQPEPDIDNGRLTNLDSLENWIDDTVERFVARAGLFAAFSRTAVSETT